MFETIATEVKAGYLEELETCSQCGEALECADSDTVFMPYCDARDLFYLRDGMAFNPVLLEQVCASCEHPVQTVQVDIIANPDITEAWADKYFCQNDIIEEPEISYTVALPQGYLDLPRRWLLFRTETAAGILDRHLLRLSEGETVAGSNGLQSCSGDPIWEAASEEVNKAWPILAGLAVSDLPGQFKFDDRIPF